MTMRKHEMERVKTRPVEGRPGVHEVMGAYRVVEWGVGGPYVMDDGRGGGRESPRMTTADPYLTGAEHLRQLGGNPRAKSSGDKTFASSLAHEERAAGKPMKRRRDRGS